MTAPFNFCHPDFCTKIVCDKVSSDGYEVTNLISEYSQAGFLAETFIKPPVNVTLEFPCNIQLQKIIINGIVGAQKTSNVNIFTCAEKQGFSSLSEFSTKMNTLEQYDRLNFKMLAKVGSRDKNIFCFTNHRFRARGEYSELQSMNSRYMGEPCVDWELRCSVSSMLSSVSHMVISITRTATGCLPAIKYIEVWGVPSLSSNDTIKQDILNVHRQIVAPTLHIPEREHISSNEEKDISVKLKTRNAIEVPNEFLDPITQEVIALPVLLPSGHTVDQWTLDRHSREEERWGRPPSDPFTGVVFTSTNKPLPNTALKVRLDSFLLQNGSRLPPNARTVGRTSHSTMFKAQNDSVSNLPKSKPSLDMTVLKQTSSSELRQEHLKRKMSSVPNENKRMKLDIVDLTDEDATIDLTNANSNLLPKKHEEKLAQSLDEALDNALNSFPSFGASKLPCEPSAGVTGQPRSHTLSGTVKLSRHNVSATSLDHKNKSAVLSRNDVKTQTTCTICDNLTEQGQLYQFPCEHIVCRTCLLSKRINNEIKCIKCNIMIDTKLIVKAHI